MMQKIKEYLNKIDYGKFFLIVGIGGLLAQYLLQLSRNILFPYSMEIKKSIEAGLVPDIDIEMLDVYGCMLSVLLLLIAPLFLRKDPQKKRKILIIVFLFFADMCGILVVIARGEIFLSYRVLIWISSIFLVSIIKDVLLYIMKHRKGDSEIMAVETYGKSEQMLKLRSKVLEAEQERLEEKEAVTVSEARKHLQERVRREASTTE